MPTIIMGSYDYECMLQLKPRENKNLRKLPDWELRTEPYKLYNYQSKKNARYHSKIKDESPQTQKFKNAR